MKNKILNRTTAYKFFVTLYLLFISMVVLTQSPLCFWRQGISGTDSSVFQTVALMMKRGFMPYRDSFDHKGPLIYLINYVGIRISPQWGIWLVEVIFMWITFAAMYRIARILCSRIGSCVILAFAARPLLTAYENFLQNGNLVEEYALPFISIALYVFLDYLHNDHVTNRGLQICGLCMGCVCLLRPNMIAVWVVFCAAIAVRCIFRKDYASLGRFISYFLGGFCIVILPILIWLAVNHALVPFWNDYIQFNLLYTSGKGGLAAFKAMCVSFLYFFSRDLIFYSFLCTLYMAYTANEQKRFLYCVYSICFLVSTIFSAVSGRTYEHYGMVLIPLLIFPMASLYSQCEKKIIHAASDKFDQKILLSLLLIAAAVVPYLKLAYENFRWTDVNYDSTVLGEVCATVETNTMPDEKISVFGNWDIIYVITGRPHATTYSYQRPIGDVAPVIMDDYFCQLTEELPKLIILSSASRTTMADVFDDFLSKNDYTLLWQEFEDTSSGTLIYSRNKV